jgi:hypothetical protein
MIGGKLKRSLKERCPECKNRLQIRERETKAIYRGNQIYIYEEFIACSNKNCEYTAELEQKRRRRQEEEFDI